MEHDYDDEDEDVVSILSNSKINAKLIELKSDPDLVKYNDDDSSSSDSDDDLLNELEMKYAFIKDKSDAYHGKRGFEKTSMQKYLFMDLF